MRADLPVLLTVADLGSLPDDGQRYEIIDGELFISAVPSFLHQTALARLLNYLNGNPVGSVVPGVAVYLMTTTPLLRIWSTSRMSACPKQLSEAGSYVRRKSQSKSCRQDHPTSGGIDT